MQVLRGQQADIEESKCKSKLVPLVGLGGVAVGEGAVSATEGNACMSAHQQAPLALSFSFHKMGLIVPYPVHGCKV